MLGKNGSHIRIYQEKGYQNDDFFFSDLKKKNSKMQASGICLSPEVLNFILYIKDCLFRFDLS